jgi:hypothetical protein
MRWLITFQVSARASTTRITRLGRHDPALGECYAAPVHLHADPGTAVGLGYGLRSDLGVETDQLAGVRRRPSVRIRLRQRLPQRAVDV